MSNEKCKGCLIYETMPKKHEVEHMVAFCGLTRNEICPCFHCLVKAMCTEACAIFRQWNTIPSHSFRLHKSWGRFHT